MQVREKVEKSRGTVVFQCFVGPHGRKVGSLKQRVRSHLVRWEMKNCAPLWREAHFQIKMLKAPELAVLEHFLKFRCRKSALHCGANQVSKPSLCAFCREVVPTKPFTNTALYYKMMLESEPTPLATKWFGGFYDGSKANVGHYKMTLRNHFVVKTGCNEKSWFATKWFLETSL